ncbi:MAG: glycosyltransferase [Patescibacteria group bacterium]|nr:glycosyltransferase [Patescibacteria group bacterium]
MKSKPTVTVGIPAYNEEASIGRLVQSILAQKHTNYNLKELIIVSDGSTDNTVKVIQGINDKRIKLISHPDRAGKTTRQNEILRLATGDYLFFCDADIELKGNCLFDNILTSLVNNEQFGIAGVNTSPKPARTAFEKCINASVSMQQEIRRKWNGGNNVLSFRGALLVLSKRYYNDIKLPNIIANDAYLYIAAIHNGFNPVYLLNTIVYYKSPATLSDHIKQASRFHVSFLELKKYLSPGDSKYFEIPKVLFFTELIAAMFRAPIKMLGYFGIQLFVKIFQSKNKAVAWDIATTTKSE